jgi:hypothetical protein
MLKRQILVVLCGAILSLVATLGVGHGSAAADDCLSREEIRAAVETGAVIAFGDLVGDLRRFGDVVSSDPCRQHGRLVYLVKIVTQAGVINSVVLDATRDSEFPMHVPQITSPPR